MTVDLALPPNFSATFADLQQRVRTLESRNALLQAAIKGGSLQIIDSSGRLVATIGALSVGTGIATADPTTGQLTFLVTDAGGVVVPYLAQPWRRTTDNFVTTSATFVTAYQAPTELVASVAVRFRVTLVVDAATTAEVRVQAAGGTLGAAAYAVATGTTFLEFSLVHGLVMESGPVTYDLQVRRASGAGNVTVWEPSALNYGATPAYGGGFPVVAGGWH